ncbi:hypothetical protein N9H08_00280 [bacterium]|nr:hypothetical protein [Flavobacteriales bacterium]MDA9001876.1 hypothetical protein [bacterium]
MRKFLRLSLQGLRWPLGAVTLFGLPAALRVIWAEIHPMLHTDHWPFWAGFVGTLVLWTAWWKSTRWARFITTIEHESLHAIVGMLTLIPVRELKVREDGSGHVLFEPPGHWLLYLSPYFIPLLLLLEIGLTGLMGLPAWAERSLLGALLGMSIVGHLRQIHPRQTDFRHAGRVFTLAFLPTAFLLAYGAAFTMLQTGQLGAIPGFLGAWGQSLLHDAQWTWLHLSQWWTG